jgi:hypothetical protein
MKDAPENMNSAVEAEHIAADLPNTSWPVPAGPIYHGITKDVVELATRSSEADPVAVAISHIVWSGAMFGRTRHINIGDEQHHGRLFAAIVGESAVARKGTSLAGPKKLWCRAEDFLLRGDGGPRAPQPFPLGQPMKIGTNLSTFEGLVYEIRDGEEPREGLDPADLDPGESDKRLLVIETELSRVLKVSKREGNTLLEALRIAWNGERMAPMTKTSRIAATEPHVCMIGHITQVELRSLLGEVNLQNGVANRIMWMLAKRSKIEPFPQPMPDSDVNRIGRELARLTTLAHASPGAVDFDNAARELWAHLFAELTQADNTILGPIKARAAPTVRRMALIYSLLDGCNHITVQHLEAAVAMWRYSSDSAGLIFGGRQADHKAQKLLDFLADGKSKTKEAIRRDCFRGNVLAPDIDRVLADLVRAKRVVATVQKKDGPGRPSVHYQLNEVAV